MSTPKPTDQMAIELVPMEEVTCEQVFCDGVHGILISPATSKIQFYEMIGVNHETRKERRKPTLTMVMPTYAMVELCKNFLSQLNDNEARLLAGFNQQKGIVFPEKIK